VRHPLEGREWLNYEPYLHQILRIQFDIDPLFVRCPTGLVIGPIPQALYSDSILGVSHYGKFSIASGPFSLMRWDEQMPRREQVAESDEEKE
jgi:hypothetical protein